MRREHVLSVTAILTACIGLNTQGCGETGSDDETGDTPWPGAAVGRAQGAITAADVIDLDTFHRCLNDNMPGEDISRAVECLPSGCSITLTMSTESAQAACAVPAPASCAAQGQTVCQLPRVLLSCGAQKIEPSFLLCSSGSVHGGVPGMQRIEVGQSAAGTADMAMADIPFPDGGYVASPMANTGAADRGILSVLAGPGGAPPADDKGCNDCHDEAKASRTAHPAFPPRALLSGRIEAGGPSHAGTDLRPFLIHSTRPGTTLLNDGATSRDGLDPRPFNQSLRDVCACLDGASSNDEAIDDPAGRMAAKLCRALLTYELTRSNAPTDCNGAFPPCSDPGKACSPGSGATSATATGSTCQASGGDPRCRPAACEEPSCSDHGGSGGGGAGGSGGAGGTGGNGGAGGGAVLCPTGAAFGGQRGAQQTCIPEGTNDLGLCCDAGQGLTCAPETPGIGRCKPPVVPCACDDGNPCNGIEGCDDATGACLPGQPISCDDGNPYNGQEICNPATGACEPFNPNPCDDGDACNGFEWLDPATGTCQSGWPVYCDNGNACDGIETCDPATGACQPGSPVACDDGNPCNGQEQCDYWTGACLPGWAPLCDNGNPCDGVETCDPHWGVCLPGTPMYCDDGNPYNGQEICNPYSGACQAEGLPQCDDGDPCNGYEWYDPYSGTCQSGWPMFCDNGDPCDGIETCDSFNGVCRLGQPLHCDDGNPYNGLETCNPSTGACDPGTPVDCDDGNPCNGYEWFEPWSGACQPGWPVYCDNGNACDGVESCDPMTGMCQPGTPPACDDGDPCNGQEICDYWSGACDGGWPLPCDDGNPDNGLETCQPGVGCVGQEPDVCLSAEDMESVRDLLSAALSGFDLCNADAPCGGVTGDCRSRPGCSADALCLGAADRQICTGASDQPCHCFDP